MFTTNQGTLTEGEGSCTVDLFVITSLYKTAIYFENICYFYYKASYINKEVNGLEPFPLVSVPWPNIGSIGNPPG
jgi:hypothetical protein